MPERTVLTDEMAEYLELLRRSGATNMFGAAPYLANEFDMSDKEAKIALIEWMESHDAS